MLRTTTVATVLALCSRACRGDIANCAAAPARESVLLQTSRHSTLQPDSFCDTCIEKFERVGGCEANLKFGWTIATEGGNGGKGGEGGKGKGGKGADVDPVVLLGGKGGKGGTGAGEDSSSDTGAVHIPAGCQRCGDAIMQQCLKDSRRSGRKDADAKDGEEGQSLQIGELQAESCATCIEDLGSADDCAVMFNGEASPPLPASCNRVSRACMTRAAVRCGVLSTEGCHTAEENEPCFEHVRWSMQHGISGNLSRYSDVGLSQESSFEKFQALIHEEGMHDCPTPCATLPETRCHTAVVGEACFGHTTWAMTAGTAIMPEWYPTALLKEEARFEDFQAWLHKIHHGDCPRPCKPDDERAEEEAQTFEYVHDGHCASGWIEGKNSQQPSVNDCSAKCYNEEECEYFSYNPLGYGSGTNCAMYTAAGGCQDDNEYPDHKSYRILRQVDTFELLGKGVCRTASGSKGTYDEPVAETDAACRAACSASSTCIAYEWKESGQECEVHTEAISSIEAEDKHLCYLRKRVVQEEA